MQFDICSKVNFKIEREKKNQSDYYQLKRENYL